MIDWTKIKNPAIADRVREEGRFMMQRCHFGVQGIAKTEQDFIKASPAFHIQIIKPALLLLHGDNDTVVNCKITERYCDSMKQQKNDCKYIPLPGAEHAFLLQGYRSKDEDVMRYMNMIDKFIEKRI